MDTGDAGLRTRRKSTIKANLKVDAQYLDLVGSFVRVAFLTSGSAEPSIWVGLTPEEAEIMAKQLRENAAKVRELWLRRRKRIEHIDR